ncbi:MAG: histidine kinase, partial [Myxococcota bacterium]
MTSAKSQTRAFWVTYGSLWLAYGALVAAAMAIETRDGSKVLPWALAHTGSGALAGLAIVRWPRSRSVPAHLGAALLFTVAWAVLATGSWSVLSGTIGDSFRVKYIGGLAKLRWQMLAGLMGYTAIATATHLRDATARLVKTERLALEAQTQRSLAELQALRARLNPHFLYNTLHTITALVRRDQDAAEDALEQFAALLRYALGPGGRDDQTVLLAEEWAVVRDYVAIETLRLGSRLRFEHDIDPEALDERIPALMLQPLVENAI